MTLDFIKFVVEPCIFFYLVVIPLVSLFPSLTFLYDNLKENKLKYESGLKELASIFIYN